MSDKNTLTPRGAFAFGLLFMACGIVPVLNGLGVIHAQTRSNVAPWVGILIGVIFACGGLSIIVSYGIAHGIGPDGQPAPGTPWVVQALQYALVVTIVGAMAAVFGWVAFGPGERHFSATIEIPFAFARGLPPVSVGRVAFGVGAVMAGAMFVAVAVSGAKRLARGRSGAG